MKNLHLGRSVRKYRSAKKNYKKKSRKQNKRRKSTKRMRFFRGGSQPNPSLIRFNIKNMNAANINPPPAVLQPTFPADATFRDLFNYMTANVVYSLETIIIMQGSNMIHVAGGSTPNPFRDQILDTRLDILFPPSSDPPIIHQVMYNVGYSPWSMDGVTISSTTGRTLQTLGIPTPPPPGAAPASIPSASPPQSGGKYRR
jgi:hypothetical protein